MLQIKHLTLTVYTDLRTVVEDFSFTLNDTDKTVLIGEEGNGKSTLLKLIHDPALIEGYAEYSGEIIKNGARTGYLAQEFSGKNLTIAEYLAQSAGFPSLNPREVYELTRELGVELDFFSSSQRCDTLSGGEKVKLQLARILVERPDILLLDEPSNDLDLGALEWLEEFISQSARPVLFVSHDEELIENTATGVIHLEQLVKKSVPRVTTANVPYRQYIDARTAAIELQIHNAKKEREEFERRQERLRKLFEKVEREQSSVSRADPHGGRMLKKKMKSLKSQQGRNQKQEQSLTKAPKLELPVMPKWEDGVSIPNGKTVLELNLPRLEVGGRLLARDIALKLVGPKKICIIGTNGVGKTTLLRLVAESLLSRNDLKTVYMPQNYADTLENAGTPVDFLCKTGDKAERSRICTFLGAMRYTVSEMSHRTTELSGGQKAKLFILKAILERANVLVLDEPTRNFSPISGPVIRELLASFGGAIVAVSHDRRFITEVCDETYDLTPDGLERRY